MFFLNLFIHFLKTICEVIKQSQSKVPNLDSRYKLNKFKSKNSCFIIFAQLSTPHNFETDQLIFMAFPTKYGIQNASKTQLENQDYIHDF